MRFADSTPAPARSRTRQLAVGDGQWPAMGAATLSVLSAALRAVLPAALSAALIAGCATRGAPPAKEPAPANAMVPATPTVPAATAAGDAGTKSATEVAVSAAAQRQFDDARLALSVGRKEDAERGFLALTKSNPELGGPHASLGMLYRQSGKLAEAVAELERAVEANPKQPVFFNQLGIAYRQQGEFRKAQDAYERAIALDETYAAAHLNLGILFDLYLWDSPRALAAYERYLALSAGDDKVTKWVADLRNRGARKPPATMLSRKEQP